ncbi:DUF397 domain-containing protein [Actinoallomurus liliacearum]|uniref:DUF397 domain-containing protein n=1 Tax=Actinoallomurus liliacearum TaxID=1080073 RepID=UPI0031EE387B
MVPRPQERHRRRPQPLGPRAPIDHGQVTGSDGGEWSKSSRSSGQGGACVEVAQWRKSGRSSDQGGNCIEVARLNAEVLGE